MLALMFAQFAWRGAVLRVLVKSDKLTDTKLAFKYFIVNIILEAANKTKSERKCSARK